MKTLRCLLISSLFTVAIFSMVTYTACNKDKCKNTTCLNSGTCRNGSCTCVPGFEGTHCEKNLCEGRTCYNGGMCVNGTCRCAAGYEGENCEIVNKFLGSYTANDVCNEYPSTYSVGITMKGNGEPILRIDHLGNYDGYAYGNISSSGNSFTISGSSYEGYTFNGSGVYNTTNGSIEIGYTVTFPGGQSACTGVWVRN